MVSTRPKWACSVFCHVVKHQTTSASAAKYAGTARNRLRQAEALYRSRERSEKDASARYRAGETGKIEMLSARLAADRAA